MNIKDIIPVPCAMPGQGEHLESKGLTYCGTCHKPKKALFPAGKGVAGFGRCLVPCACRNRKYEKENKGGEMDGR